VGPKRKQDPWDVSTKMATRKPTTTAFWNGRLPHWEVEGGRYFITIHLAGAIPRAGRQRLRAIAARLSKLRERGLPEWLRLQRMIFAEMEVWLDSAQEGLHLHHRDIAEMVVEAIDERSRRGDWRMFEYVVMPTHVHLFCELGRRGLQATCEDFKRWTGHRGATILGARWSAILAARMVRPLVALG
jgi:predicted transcriptional regulator